jgi:pyridoxamine 5'-phosphate oxidase
MNAEDVYAFANQNPASWMATAIEGQPHIRGMLLWFADATGFYYHTASCKTLASQIKTNPKMEIAFQNQAAHMSESRMLRVAGTVECLQDSDLTERLFTERPWVNSLSASMPAGTEVILFRLINGKARFWDLTVNGREGSQPSISC